MKKLLILVTVIIMTACSKPELPINDTHSLEVTIVGNSPECFINGSVNRHLTIPYVSTTVHTGDVVTVYGHGYTVDNSNNYGAPNYQVISKIDVKVDGVLVKSGTEMIYYQIQ